MTTGILLITHSGIGRAMIDTVENTFGTLPMPMHAISVGKDADPETLVKDAIAICDTIDQGEGILVLTDIMGSTPSNIAQQVQKQDRAVKVIAGLNLPMLFKIITYRTLPLKALATKAVSGAREGIVMISEMDLIGITRKKSEKSKPPKPKAL